MLFLVQLPISSYWFMLFVYPYTSGLLHCHWDNYMTAPVKNESFLKDMVKGCWLLTKTNKTKRHFIMTSHNGNTLRVTRPLLGKSSGLWWIPLTKGRYCILWCFLLMSAETNNLISSYLAFEPKLMKYCWWQTLSALFYISFHVFSCIWYMIEKKMIFLMNYKVLKIKIQFWRQMAIIPII